MKTITENSVISLMQLNYGTESIHQRIEKVYEELAELKAEVTCVPDTNSIRSEIADVYSVIIDIADRYGMHLDDVARMTIAKHKERGKV